MKISLLSALSALAMTGCAPTLVHLPVSFDQSGAKALMLPGTNTVTGTIKFEPDKGHVFAYPDTFVTCEGNEVTLIPYTDYAREWALKYYGKPVTDIAYKLTHRAKNMIFDNYDQFMAATRKTQCDAHGNFSFDHVANGDFFVMAKVVWKGRDEEMYNFAFAPEDIDEEDGTVIKKISLKGNEALKLAGPWP
ncbi:MAG: hypothetical protein ACKN9W_08775 [Methylococcus sp.]